MKKFCSSYFYRILEIVLYNYFVTWVYVMGLRIPYKTVSDVKIF